MLLSVFIGLFAWVVASALAALAIGPMMSDGRNGDAAAPLEAMHPQSLQASWSLAARDLRGVTETMRKARP